MLNPIDDEELYQSIILGGLRSPGQVTLSGHDRKIDWDIKTAPGTKGASTTLKGLPPVEFTATFYLVRDEALGIDDFSLWDDFYVQLMSTISGPTPKALDIYHPDLAKNDIVSVVLSSFGGVVHDGKGGMTITVRLLEYKPPKPKGGSPTGSKPKAKTKTPDPDAAALAELAKLTDEYKRTPWG